MRSSRDTNAWAQRSNGDQVAGGVLTLVRLSTVVPNAPGNLGLINLACVMALGIFEVEKNDAKTFSIILFVAFTMPHDFRHLGGEEFQVIIYTC
jgi:hypothetical protein